MCNTKFGYTGGNCTDWCGQAVGVLSINVVAMIMALILALASGYFICKILQIHRFNRLMSPVFVTLLFIVIGSTLLVAALIVQCTVVLGFPHLYQLSYDPNVSGRVIRRPSQSLDNASYVLIAVANCISLCSVVILPLTWVSFFHIHLIMNQELTEQCQPID